MKTLTVDLGNRSYPIYIGEHILTTSEYYVNYLGKQALIVTNETVAPLYLDKLKQQLQQANIVYDTVILPDGEQYKTLSTYEKILDTLLEKKHSRKTTVIALGGGVIGDMAGFAAATYQRGVFFVQIPTTLLAQVDSSVGGKVAVNHSLGKNMIGAFYQPQCVIADTSVLTTLPPREFSAGMAEVIKYGLIRDQAFLIWLEKNIKKLMQQSTEEITYAIEQSCHNKAKIVAEDEFESGVRALLNLGHTFGHALETGFGYGVLLHGEAVAIGMVLAAQFSQQLGLLEANDVQQVIDLCKDAGLPTEVPAGITADEMLVHMSRDKKVEDNKIRLVLLKSLGEAFITDDYSLAELKIFLTKVCH